MEQDLDGLELALERFWSTSRSSGTPIARSSRVPSGCWGDKDVLEGVATLQGRDRLAGCLACRGGSTRRRDRGRVGVSSARGRNVVERAAPRAAAPWTASTLARSRRSCSRTMGVRRRRRRGPGTPRTAHGTGGRLDDDNSRSRAGRRCGCRRRGGPGGTRRAGIVDVEGRSPSSRTRARAATRHEGRAASSLGTSSGSGRATGAGPCGTSRVMTTSVNISSVGGADG